MLSDDLLILFAGRACGGVSTTLLYSVFETWMIAEYHDQALDAYGLSLGSMFGKMTTLSGVVAIVSGVVGDVLVRSLDSKTSPFMASVVCLGLAFVFISKRWVSSSRKRIQHPVDMFRMKITETTRLVKTKLANQSTSAVFFSVCHIFTRSGECKS
jgi:hypothetical protein